jgi:hypothetical protein
MQGKVRRVETVFTLAPAFRLVGQPLAEGGLPTDGKYVKITIARRCRQNQEP